MFSAGHNEKPPDLRISHVCDPLTTCQLDDLGLVTETFQTLVFFNVNLDNSI